MFGNYRTYPVPGKYNDVLTYSYLGGKQTNYQTETRIAAAEIQCLARTVKKQPRMDGKRNLKKQTMNYYP